MRVVHDTHVGAVRKANEDACKGGQLPGDGAWAVVCDGMGGANGGSVASALALERIEEYLTKNFREGLSGGSMKSLLLNALGK